MNTTAYSHPTAEEGVYCRPTMWMDVVKFFVLNYGLHAFTVVPRPGGGAIFSIVDGLASIMMPFYGTRRALLQIGTLAFLLKDQRKRATVSGALCMVVPASTDFGLLVSPSLTSIHGQHPFPVLGCLDWIKKPFRLSKQVDQEASDQLGINPSDYKIVTVPQSYTVHSSHTGIKSEMEIACNYSIVKTAAAIIQIFYGSYELYEAATRSDQFSRFGYAAYSLTVTPYVLMSYLNLLASLARPSYPSVYLVYYRGDQEPETPAGTPGGEAEVKSGGNSYWGILMQQFRERYKEAEDTIEAIKTPAQTEEDAEKRRERARKTAELDRRERLTEDQVKLMEKVNEDIDGTVGCAYGTPASMYAASTEDKKVRDRWGWRVIGALAYFPVASPYVITHFLTKFRPEESTVSQRVWTMLSLMLGQVMPVVAVWLPIHGIMDAAELVNNHKNSGGLATRIKVWLENPHNALLGLFLFTVLISVPTIGSFVVVAQMMLEDQVCVKV